MAILTGTVESVLVQKELPIAQARLYNCKNLLRLKSPLPAVWQARTKTGYCLDNLAFNNIDYYLFSKEDYKIFGGTKMINEIRKILSEVEKLDKDLKISIINEIKIELNKISPFKNNPVDCVIWIKNNNVIANDYNPNSVAPPEMRLLEHSIREDGYTQPIVTWKNNGNHEVVDGFHRNRVGREIEDIKENIYGYLPIVVINKDRSDRGDRIASTIRHNRARGKHQIDGMSDIVLELRRRNWSHKKIGIELGMDQDEVLRLTQISGLAEMFSDKDFSEAWEADILADEDFEGDLDTID